MAEIVLTKENFDAEVMQAKETVLIDFWASWCGPCRMLAPTVAQLAEEYAGRVKVGKVNVDEQPELAEAFRIVSIPTLVVLKEGKVTDISVGYRPKEEIEALLK